MRLQRCCVTKVGAPIGATWYCGEGTHLLWKSGSLYVLSPMLRKFCRITCARSTRQGSERPNQRGSLVLQRVSYGPPLGSYRDECAVNVAPGLQGLELPNRCDDDVGDDIPPVGWVNIKDR